MADDIQNEVALHHAGAIVRHKSPFAEIAVSSQKKPLPKAIIDKWVIPFYWNRVRDDATKFTEALRPIYHEIDDDLISTLLSEFNWRPRLVAAYFAAITNRRTHEEHIGKLLLRSDVCYAGRGYCLALARFNTHAALNFLTEYLDYYLTQTELYFDQGVAMAAIMHMDIQNGTDNISHFMPAWSSFTSNKTNWNLDNILDLFSKKMHVINLIAQNAR